MYHTSYFPFCSPKACPNYAIHIACRIPHALPRCHNTNPSVRIHDCCPPLRGVHFTRQPQSRTRSRACLKNHSRNLHVPICDIFCPNSVVVAHYAALICTKDIANCNAHLAESLFQTRSSIAQTLWKKCDFFSEIFF